MIHEVSKFIEQHGGPDKAAAASGYARSTLYAWANGTRKPDPNRLADISQRLGIPKQKLRPDLFKV